MNQRFQLYHGDYATALAKLTLPKHVAVIADPPYGDAHDTDYTRFTKGVAAHRNWLIPIPNDDKPFDPSPWLSHETVVLFGANRFSDKLSTGTWLIWDKRTPGGNKAVMSDAEVAWWNKGRGIYIFDHMWDGFNRASERNTAYHPTQKPVALMRWVIEKLRLPQDAVILDPYMGSGPVGVAAMQAGYRYIGCEIDGKYFDVALKRITDAARAADGLNKQLAGNAADYDGLPMFQPEAI